MGINLAVFTASKMKDREMKEIKEEPPSQPKVPASSSEQLKLNIPKWDLSIQGLQQVCTTCGITLITCTCYLVDNGN